MSTQWDEEPGNEPVPGEALSVRPPASASAAEAELSDIALNWLQTNVLRLLVTRVVPLVLGSGLVTGAAAWAQDAIGMDLPTEVVASVALPMLVGVVAVAFAYIRGHAGAAKLGEAVLKLAEIRELGEQQLRDQKLLEATTKR